MSNNYTLNSKIHKLTRFNLKEDNIIQTVEPIRNRKKIFVFGQSIKQIDAVVESLEPQDFSINKVFNVFSEEFSGEIKLESLNVNQYADIPFDIVNMTGIGESNLNLEQIKTKEPIIMFKGLNDYYNINWATTFTAGLGTGLNLNLSGKNLEILKKTNSVSFFMNDKKKILNGDKLLLQTIGSSIGRKYSSFTIAKTDPLQSALQKTLIITTVENDTLGLNKGSTKASIFTVVEMMNKFRTTLKKGQVATFIKSLISESDINIYQTNESPMVKMLQDGSYSYATSSTEQIAENTVLKPQITTVGAIVQQILNAMGMELYYNVRNNTYSLEQPRMLSFENSKSAIELSYDNIISINSTKNLSFMPSLFIPEVDFKNMYLASAAQRCSKYLAQYIVSQLSKIKNLPYFKIQTFTVPEFFFPQYKEYDKNYLLNNLDDLFGEIWIYYAKLAFRTTLSQVNTGSIEIVFNPDIQEPFKWYKIEKEWYFVTNIQHSISRGRASTVLQYAGIYDKQLYTIIEGIKKLKASGTMCKNDKNQFFKDKHTPFNKAEDKHKNKSKEDKKKVDELEEENYVVNELNKWWLT